MRRRQRGAAVVTALLVVALCVTLVTTMFVQQQASTRAVESRRLRAQGESLQGAVTAWATAALQENGSRSPVDHLRQPWAQPRAPAPLSAWIGAQAARGVAFTQGGDAVTLGGAIEDAQARFNLMTLVSTGDRTQPPGVSAVGVAAYRKLLSTLSLDSALAGSTAAYVLRSLRPDGPLPLTRASDLLAISGYTGDAVAKLAPFVVALPMPTTVNMNTAGPEVLAAFIPGVTVSQARTMIADRDRAFWRDLGDLSLRLKALAPAAPEPQGLMIDARSRYFIVHGEARGGRAVRRFVALIYREGIGASLRTRVVWVREQDPEELP
ncbi:type II secretion system minor pseudopilin GspK [Cupriavidus sp. WS]|uniref:type II secretion system minor pseudopilin GspK n=1 Tax=Cupriavidus sp. WS TaxID=1312922 RepID=UPI00035E642A|nr:type II secretion system minor pseudopilin GspK [Cupriavidus sp. WS]